MQPVVFLQIRISSREIANASSELMKYFPLLTYLLSISCIRKSLPETLALPTNRDY